MRVELYQCILSDNFVLDYWCELVLLACYVL